MKHLLPVLIAFLALLPGTHTNAATVDLQGRILGFSTPTDPDVSTINYYWFTARSDTLINVAVSVLGSPFALNTGLDLSFYYPPDEEGFVRIFGTVRGNTSGLAFANAGRFFVAAQPGNSNFDGYWPLPPVEGNDTEFIYFDYRAALEGDIYLTEVWTGQRDGTFRITYVPEPGGLALCALAGTAMLARRRGDITKNLASIRSACYIRPV